jgi:phosphoribosylformylglycinamidine (FGAM) synthase PurS component
MILKLFKTRIGNDVTASKLLRQLRNSGYDKLDAISIEHVLRVEGITSPDLAQLQPIFANPVIEQAGPESFLSPGSPIVEISYQRAVTDPELDSILHAAQRGQRHAR